MEYIHRIPSVLQLTSSCQNIARTLLPGKRSASVDHANVVHTRNPRRPIVDFVRLVHLRIQGGRRTSQRRHDGYDFPSAAGYCW